jgi:hypothetical protein
MDLWALRALVLDLNFETHGVPIVVSAPDGSTPIETRGIWSTPTSFDATGGRAERRRVLCVAREVSAHTPRGTEIVAPDPASTDEVIWTVDGTDREEADRVYLILLPPDAEDA